MLDENGIFCFLRETSSHPGCVKSRTRLPAMLVIESVKTFHRKSIAISIKVVHEQSGKVECERERLLGIAKKLMNFHSSYSTFPLYSGTTLIEIAVYNYTHVRLTNKLNKTRNNGHSENYRTCNEYVKTEHLLICNHLYSSRYKSG